MPKYLKICAIWTIFIPFVFFAIFGRRIFPSFVSFTFIVLHFSLFHNTSGTCTGPQYCVACSVRQGAFANWLWCCCCCCCCCCCIICWCCIWLLRACCCTVTIKVLRNKEETGIKNKASFNKKNLKTPTSQKQEALRKALLDPCFYFLNEAWPVLINSSMGHVGLHQAIVGKASSARKSSLFHKLDMDFWSRSEQKLYKNDLEPKLRWLKHFGDFKVQWADIMTFVLTGLKA